MRHDDTNTMTKETTLCATLGIDRKELRTARQNGIYEYGEDYAKVGSSICWTDAGKRKLAGVADVEVTDLEPEDGEERTAVVLRAKIFNHRLIRCDVEGIEEPQIVNVGDNRLYRPGDEILVERRGNGWRGTRKPKSQMRS
jgi:hypothetical protein